MEGVSAAIGIAAFGITVCQGLVNYYASFASAKDDVSRLIASMKQLTSVLTILEEVVKEATTANPSLLTIAQKSILDCTDSIEYLNRKLDKIKVNSENDKFQDKAIALGHRVLYPLKSTTVSKLSGVVNGLLLQLAPATAAIQIKISNSTNQEIGQINTSINLISQGLQDINVVVSKIDEKSNRHRYATWLNPPDPVSNFQRNISKWKQRTTGQWIIQHSTFKIWIQSSHSLLWLYGIPGCGKSMLSSIIIQHLEERLPAKSATAFFYFDFNDPEKQNPYHMLASLVKQFMHRSSAVLGPLEGLYKSCQDGERKPNKDQLMSVLEGLISDFEVCYIVVDALDECIPAMMEDLLDIIQEFNSWQTKDLRLLVTSRELRIISEFFEALPGAESISVQGNGVDEDIRLHIRKTLESDRNLRKWPKDTQEYMEQCLVEKSHNMFQWVICQLNVLRLCRTKADLKKAVESLPETLEETYHRILIGIPKIYRADALTILQWLKYSARPVTITEIAEALSIDLTSRPLPIHNPERKLHEPEVLLDYCSSLVTHYTPDEDWRRSSRVGPYLNFSHQSVNEYLSTHLTIGTEWLLQFDAVSCHATIAQCCVAHLLRSRSNEASAQLHSSQLDSYWMEFFPIHGISAEEQDKVIDLCLKLFTSEKPWIIKLNDRWLRRLFGHPSQSYIDLEAIKEELERRHRLDYLSDSESRCFSLPLRYASLLGFRRLIARLLETWLIINRSDRRWLHALVQASKQGYTELVELLLEAGCDAKAVVSPSDISFHSSEQKYSCNSALEYAANFGHIKTVQLLLKNGAPLTISKSIYSQPSCALVAAVYGGHQSIVSILLDQHAAIDASNIPFREAFVAVKEAPNFPDLSSILRVITTRALVEGAIVHDDGKVGGILYAFNADINAVDENGATELHHAAHRIGYYDHSKESVYAIKLLIYRGADVNAKDNNGETPLFHTSNVGAMKALLECGADPQVSNKWRATPMSSWENQISAAENYLADGYDQWHARTIYEDMQEWRQRLRLLQEYASKII